MDRHATRVRVLCPDSIPFQDTSHGVFSAALVCDLVFLFDAIQLQQYKKFLDLGSGDGRVVFVAAQYTKATGVEADELVYQRSKAIKQKLSISCTLLHQEYFSLDFSHYDALFFYPDTTFCHAVEQKIVKEFSGLLIVYSSIFLPSKTPLRVIDLHGMVARVYDYSSN